MSQILFRQSQLKASRQSQRFPQINNKYIQSDMNRQSLKKLNHSKHNSQFPKLIAKKKNDTSLVQHFDRVKSKGKKMHKRQKLHTQGMIIGSSEQFSQIDDSFISLTNQLNQQDNDNTMMNFRKKIQANKQYIKQEMEKKNKQNKSNKNIGDNLKINMRSHEFIMKKKRINSSKILDTSHSPVQKAKKTLETPKNSKRSERSQQKSIQKRSQSNTKAIRQNNKSKERYQKTNSIKKSNTKVSEKRLPKRESNMSEGLFSELQVMLNERMVPQKQKKKQQQSKLKNLIQKLNKFKRLKPYASSNYIIDDQLDSSLCQYQKLKGQSNCLDWNKLDISSTSEISYRKSSFEQELHKVSEYADRSDLSLQKYLHNKKQLLKYGFQVFSNKKST